MSLICKKAKVSKRVILYEPCWYSFAYKTSVIDVLIPANVSDFAVQALLLVLHEKKCERNLDASLRACF